MKYIIELEIEDWNSEELHDLISQSLPDLDKLIVRNTQEVAEDIHKLLGSYSDFEKRAKR